VSDPSLLTSWSLEPLQLLPAALVGAMFGKRVHTLARRGTPVPRWRQFLFWLGTVLVLVALVSPLDAFAEEEFFSAHMLQHVLLGDLAPLCFVAALNGPILRPVLRFRVVDRLRILVHPFVALPLWAVNLYVWHIPFFYEGALHHDAVHALEHLLFFTCGALMWAPVVETLPAPEWFGTGAKLGYIACVRLIETVLGNVFLWSGRVFYPFYDGGHGLSALQDQGLAGAVMMGEGSLVTLAALSWLFLRMGAEGELRQRLLEEGLDPRAVRRAVRYGRGKELKA
jgi:putative membrane protein